MQNKLFNKLNGGGQNNLSGKKNRLFKLFNIVFLSAAVLCGAVFASPYLGQSADAATANATTTVIGELTLDGTGNANSNGKAFNGNNLTKLYEYLTGSSTTATFADVSALVAGTQNYGASSTIPTLVSSADMREKNNGKNLILEFGGKEWTATSLTRDNNGNVILSLWSNYTELCHYAVWFGDTATYSYAYPANMYSASYIRAYALNGGRPVDSTGTIPATLGYSNHGGGSVHAAPAQREASGYARFTMASIGGVTNEIFNYIVRPMDVKYQEIQSMVNHKASTGVVYSIPNEAWGTPDQESIGRGFNYTTKTRYDDWKYDTLWLPSMTEIGNGRAVGDTTYNINGIWLCDNVQKTYSNAGASYVRTLNLLNEAPWNAPCGNGALTCGGSPFPFQGYYTNETHGVRPALHLNLTAADAAAAYEAPSDVETVYNGDYQNCGTVSLNAPSDIEWYTAGFYLDTSKVTVKYFDKSNNPITDTAAIDVGDYYAEFTLAGGGYIWTDSTDNTDLTRKIKFTIKKKPIELDFAVDLSTGALIKLSPKDPSQVYARDTLTLGVNYKGKASGNSNTSPSVTGYDSATAPIIWGDYIATAFIDVPTGVTSNYELSGTTSIPFTREKDKALVPSISGAAANKTYDGTTQQVSITNFETAKVSISTISKKNAAGTYVLTTDATWTSPNTYVEVKNAGEYQVEFSVSNDFVWADGSPNSTKKTINFTVKKKDLTLTLVNDEASGAWAWQMGTAVTATLTASGAVSGDNIVFELAYYQSGNTAAPEGTATSSQNAGGDFEASLVISADAGAGAYSLQAALKAGAGESDNYSIDAGALAAGLPKTFNILAQQVSVSALTWQVLASGSVTPQAIAENGTVKYALYLDPDGNETPVTYTVTLDTSAFAAMHLEVDTTKYTNGYDNNTCSTVQNNILSKVAIKTTDPNYTILDSNNQEVTSIELELHWSVLQGTFDLANANIKWEYLDPSGAVHDYVGAIEYEKKFFTVRPKESSLPLGLKLATPAAGSVLGINSRGRDIKTYTATFYQSDFTCDPNFDSSSIGSLNFDWEISPKMIPVQWKTEKRTNALGNDYYFPVIDCDPSLAQYIEYTFYDDSGNELPNGLADIDAQAVGSNILTFRVEAKIKSGETSYALKNTSGGSNDKVFQVGDGKILARVEIDNLSDAAYEAGKQYFTPASIRLVDDSDGSLLGQSDYTLTYYRGTTADPANMLPVGVYPEAAGEYYLEIELAPAAAGTYSLSKSGMILSIAKQKVAVPVFTAPQFTGSDITLESCLSGFNGAIMEIVGDAAGRNARTYSAIIRLKDTDNYEWDTSSVNAPEVPASYVSRTAEIYGSDCQMDWQIEKAVLKAEWGKEGDYPAVTSVSAFRELINQGKLGIEYRYYAPGEAEPTPASELQSGVAYTVEAVLVGDDAENIIFEDTQNVNSVMTGTFELPKNGFLAVMGSLGTVLANNWWWILIGLGALLLLILLIVIIKKRKKKKEEKQAKKEAEEEKAEKKRLREEEEEEERQRRKRRREEEEEEERRRRKAQLEAQQQPMANPAAGAMAGTMAMPMAQPVIVQQPAVVQQPQVQPQAQAQPQAQPKAAERPKILIRQNPQSAEADARVKAAEERARRAEELLRKALDDRAKNAVAQTQQNNGYMQPQTLNPFSQNASPYAMPFGNLYNAPSPELRAMEERVRAAEERARGAEDAMRRFMEMQMIQRGASPQTGGQNAEMLVAQERMRAQEDRIERLVEERMRAAEERALRAELAGKQSGNSAMPDSDFLKTLLEAALRGRDAAPAAQTEEKNHSERNVLPITFTAVSSENVDASEEVAKVTLPTGLHSIPRNSVMTSTTTTTVDTTGKKKQPDRRELYDTDFADHAGRKEK